MLFVKLLILLTTVQHAFSGGGFCSPNVTGTQYITITVRNETILNPSIQSPNYPNSYPTRIDCVWKITVPSGKRVKFTFTQMVLEYRGSACNADYIELRSGLKSYSSKIGRYCGLFPPSSQYSSGRYMWVRFHSDVSVTKTGFSANYEAVDDAENPDNHEGFCSPNITGYQYITLTTNSGTIQSPYYPNSYPNNIDCVWKITVPYGKEVNLTFTHMSLQYMFGCTADYVELRQGFTPYSNRIGSYCGSSLPSSKYSNGRYMLVKFHSDGNVTDAGFTANFEAVEYAIYTDNSDNSNSGRSGSSSWITIGGSTVGTIFFIILVCCCCCCYCCGRRKRKKPKVIIREVVTEAPAASPNVVVVSNVNVNQQQVSVPPPPPPQPQQQHPQAVMNPAYSPAAYPAPSPHESTYPLPPHGYAYPPSPQGSAYPPPPQGYTYPPSPQGPAYPSAPPEPAYPQPPQGAYVPYPGQEARPPPYNEVPVKQ